MTMDTRLKKLAVRLLLTAVLFITISSIMAIVHSNDLNGKIDLFAQKEPYSGKGLNMPSDSFGPGENVTIYALVTYNDYPVQNALVSFVVQGPENPIENITQSRVIRTNESGVAFINVGLGLQDEIYFGEWSVIGKVKIAENIVCQDILSFKVGWIVNIVTIKTIDEDYVEQTEFTTGSRVGIELTLQNIAMTEKKVTITLTVHDELNTPIQFVEIENLILHPNGILVYPYFFMIPKDAVIGEAVVYASAYTDPLSLGGIPYCPEVSKSFFITGRDITILSVQPHPTVVFQGETVNIDVTVRNKGWKTESFNVSAYYNETLIDTSPVLNLQPHTNATLSFSWDTDQLEKGFYRISAYAEPVQGEIDVFDNNLINGFVEVIVPVHDVSVVSVVPSIEIVYAGENVDINVKVKNEGNYAESFNVSVYYDSNVFGTIFIDSLMPDYTEMLVFKWNTGGVTKGNYTLSAFASPVEGEEDVDDNGLTDGVVEVRRARTPTGWFVPDWVWLLLLPLLILLLILLAILIYRRRKKKKVEGTFHSGWITRYYCNDLRARDKRF